MFIFNFEWNRPISPNVRCMCVAAITLVHKRQAAVLETPRAVSCFACTELQRGWGTCRKMQVPSMHCGSSGFAKLACEVGLLQLKIIEIIC